jgi:hypothetical protein
LLCSSGQGTRPIKKAILFKTGVPTGEVVNSKSPKGA